MKKLLFSFIFFITIVSFCSTVVAKDIYLLIKDFSLAIHSENESKSFMLDTSLPADNLFYPQENMDLKKEKPPLKAGKIVLEILGGIGGGAAGGIGGFLVGALIGYIIFPESEEGFDILAIGLLSAGVGIPFGSALGVYLIGRTGNETGSFWMTFLGAIVGGSLGLIGIYLFNNSPLLIFIGAISVPIGACIFFNLTRKYRSSSPSKTALLNFKNGKIELGIPMVSVQPTSHLGVKDLDLKFNFNLISFEF